ncbi:MAG: TylF/MycF/NovP-related O-methyltransferase [Breznakibacter sp.]
MSTIQFLNLLLVNAIAWVLMAYFWSFWTHKLFKPYMWLDYVKQKQVPKTLVRTERKEKDRIRFYMLWQQLERIVRHQVPGNLAELGVYKGETAKVIHHMLPDRKFYLFDTFDGLPHQVMREDCDGTVRPQTVKFDNTSPELVKKHIGGNDLIDIRQGIFPGTADDLGHEVFAFVHIDADLYQSTIDALRFFYPRLSSGGVIIIHDYNHNWEGVRKAVDEFSRGIAEQFVDMPDQLGSVVLIKNRTVK